MHGEENRAHSAGGRSLVEHGSVRGQGDGKGFKWAEVFALPKVTEAVFSFGQLEVFPGIAEFLGNHIEIEDSQVIPFSLSRVCEPDCRFVCGKNGVISGGAL